MYGLWGFEDRRGDGGNGGELPFGFRGVEVLALVSEGRGNALLINVEKESITMILVFGGGFEGVGCVRRARRWARVGVEKWVRFERRVERVAGL